MPGRLLIVDDEKAMRLALKSLLAKEGYEVETAESGEQALRAIEAGSFHMVITDLSLKDVDGMDVRVCSSTCAPPCPTVRRLAARPCARRSARCNRGRIPPGA